MNTIKAIDLKKWTVTFWLVKRYMANHVAHYSVLRVSTDPKLQKRLTGYVASQLQGKDFHLAEYDFNNGDGDDTLFTITADATDFPKVEVAINAGFDNAIAREYQDLLNSWAYVVQLEHGNDRLYAWRKISTLTQPKKVQSRQATFFLEHKLVDVEDKEVFLIDPRFDFFVHGGMIFIANKKDFEISMNFREGMKAKAAEVIRNFNESGHFKNVDLIQKHVGDNMHHLRKMASILKAGYYRQPDYIQRMIAVSKEEGWELKVEDGQVVVEEETIDLLLKLLNNDRLRSPINNEIFDAAAKAPVR
ncbi:MAG: DUF4868 domain-containing protein [Pseudomonadota bacterium]